MPLPIMRTTVEVVAGEEAATPHEMSKWGTCESQRRTLTLRVQTRFSTKPSHLHSAQKPVGLVAEDGEVQGDDLVQAYNPGKGFFDSLPSSTRTQPPAQRGTGRGGRGGAHHRREEERKRNVATFGEPGGVGLMGPGAYVGGWGGYGRRGGCKNHSFKGGGFSIGVMHPVLFRAIMATECNWALQPKAARTSFSRVAGEARCALGSRG